LTEVEKIATMHSQEREKEMNRFFKAISEDGKVLGMLIADNQSRAEVQFLFQPWCSVFTKFTVIECSRQEFFGKKFASTK